MGVIPREWGSLGKNRDLFFFARQLPILSSLVSMDLRKNEVEVLGPGRDWVPFYVDILLD